MPTDLKTIVKRLGEPATAVAETMPTPMPTPYYLMANVPAAPAADINSLLGITPEMIQQYKLETEAQNSLAAPTPATSSNPKNPLTGTSVSRSFSMPAPPKEPGDINSQNTIEKMYWENAKDLKNQVKGYEDELSALGNKPTGWATVDLSPLMAMSDSWSGGRLAQSYKAPTAQAEWEQKKALLQKAIQAGNKELSDQQMDLLKQKYGQAKTNDTLAMQMAIAGLRNDMATDKMQRADQNQSWGMEKDLRHQHQGDQVTKNTKEISRWWGAIQQMRNAKAGIDDVGLVNAINKMLDPNSVVREKEFEVAARSGGLINLARNYVAAKATGKFLDPRTRADMVRLAEGIYQEQLQRQGELNQSYAETASMYPGVRLKAVIGDMKYNANAAPTGPKPGDIEDGQKFKGGDPGDPKNWEAVKNG